MRRLIKKLKACFKPALETPQAGQWRYDEPFRCHEHVKPQINTYKLETRPLLRLLGWYPDWEGGWVFSRVPQVCYPFFPPSSQLPLGSAPKSQPGLSPVGVSSPSKSITHGMAEGAPGAGPGSLGKAKLGPRRGDKAGSKAMRAALSTV